MKNPKTKQKAEVDFKALQDGLIKVAKANLERDGTLAPVLFIIAEQEGVIPVMMENWSREQFPRCSRPWLTVSTARR